MKHPVTLLLDLTSAILCALPESVAVVIAKTMGAIWWHVLRYRRSIILENLQRAFPELSNAERKKLGSRATVHLSRTLLEFFRIPRFVQRGFQGYAREEDLDCVHRAKKEGKGVLVIAAHTGSFELAVAAFGRSVAPIHLVVKPFPAPVDAFILRVRASAGLQMISAKNAVKPILSALKRNETVVFAIDQNATRSIGVFVDFFGVPASTMSAVATLAARTQSPVVAALPYRAEEGTHVLKMHPAIPWEEQATREETIVHMTQRYTQVVERAIREHPAQWFWTHKRWKTRPLSEKEG